MAAAIRVLYVDDEPSLLDIGKLFLEQHGDFTVTTAMSAPEGIRLLEEEKFDAIISDYQMPDMDGIQFLVEVRKRFGPTPFILFTGRGREEVVIEALNNGADFYLQKGGEPGAQFAELSHMVKQAALRKRAEDSLRENEDNLRAILDATPFPVALVDLQDNNINFWSHSALTLFGHTAPTTPAWYQLAYPDPDYQRDVIERWKPCLEEAQISGLPVNTGEYRVNCRDGSVRICEIYATFLADKLIVTFNDITERKQAEEALRESEETFRIHIENSFDVIFTLNSDGEFVFVSPAWERHFGYPVSDVIGKSFAPFVHPEDIAPLVEYLKRVLTTGQSEASPAYRVRHADGRWLWLIANGTPVVNTKGEQQFVGVGRDITERKRAEEALKEHDEKIRLLMDSTAEAIYGLDMNGNCTFCNNSCLSLLGYKHPDELLGRNMHWQIHHKHPDGTHFPVEDCRIFRAFNKGEGTHVDDEVLWRSDGTSFPAEYWSYPQRHEGKVVGAVVTFLDITERKQVEEKLIFSNLLLSTQNELSIDGILVVDESGKIISFNRRFVEIWGIPEEVVASRSDDGALHSVIDKLTDPEEFFARIKYLYVNREEISREEITLKDGRVFDRYSAPMSGSNGEYYGRVWNFRDITERKKNEHALAKKTEELLAVNDELTAAGEELKAQFDALTESEHMVRESEEKYRTIFNNFTDLYYMTDINGIITTLSPSVKKLSGWTPEELIGHSTNELYPFPEEKNNLIDKLLRTGKVNDYEVTLLHKNGNYIKTSISCHVIYDDAGKPSAIEGTLRDITERRQAEEALKQLSERLSLATRAGGVGIWDYDVVNNTLNWDDQMFALYGITRELFSGAYEAWQAGLHPDDRLQGDVEIQMALRGEKEFDIEFRVLWPDGSIHSIRAFAIVQRDAGGKPLRMIGTNWDLTERKRAEEALLQASKKLAMLNSITRHDILNQLMGLRTYLELSKMDVIDPVVLTYIQKEEQAAEAIQWQIEFTKNYQDIGGQAPKWQNLSDIIGSAVSQLKPPGVEINVAVDRAEVFADPLLEKVFYNLMENSLRHGEHVTRIDFSVKEMEPGLILTYADNGVGVTTEDKKKLFVKGFGKHTGLGLFLSKEILSITGITITETGEPGTGARFEMTVPKGAWRIANVQQKKE